MSGYKHEMDYAKRHGVQLIENRLPTYVVRGDAGKLLALRVALAKDGRAVPGTEAELACDVIAVAIGQSKATKIALEFQGVRVDDKGRVVVDPRTGRTGHPKVWAGGDCVNGGMEVVNAVQEGKIAMRSIMEALRGR
jgi:glutamate synthase (NADPH/NADH) small chain